VASRFLDWVDEDDREDEKELEEDDGRDNL
jgi:hypothetical protein